MNTNNERDTKVNQDIQYNQVARILTPIVSTLDKLDYFENDVDLLDYVKNTYGSIEQCKKDILCKYLLFWKLPLTELVTDDLFTFGFDGSGGDNYFDAGSCIDGRLTSAWNCKLALFDCQMKLIMSFRVFNYREKEILSYLSNDSKYI